MKMYPITRARLWLRCLISGEKCIACGEMNTHGEGLMCRECEDSLKRSHLLICPECSRYARDCLCVPRIMRENRVEYLIKYAFYDPRSPESALNRIIRRLKHIPDGLTFAYFAAVLSKPIKELSSARGYTRENTLVTYIPRSRKNIALDGYDQAKSLARAIAKRSGFGHKTLLRRLKHGKQQKYLHLNERIENVKGMFSPEALLSVSGKNIIIVDDLVTTGATVSEAAKVLYAAGAAEIVCVCIAESDGRNRIDFSAQ